MLGALFFVALDLLTKSIAPAFALNPIQILPFFSLEYHQNTGIAWSIQIPYFILIPLNIGILMLLPWCAQKYLKTDLKIAQLALMLVLGGAIGNIYDRLFLGYVRDFIAIGRWPVFNLADASLCTGIFLILAFYGRIKRV